VYQSIIKEKLPPNFCEKSYALLAERTSKGELTLTGVEWEKPNQVENH
jgi:hypothetical protein